MFDIFWVYREFKTLGRENVALTETCKRLVDRVEVLKEENKKLKAERLITENYVDGLLETRERLIESVEKLEQQLKEKTKIIESEVFYNRFLEGRLEFFQKRLKDVKNDLKKYKQNGNGGGGGGVGGWGGSNSEPYNQVKDASAGGWGGSNPHNQVKDASAGECDGLACELCNPSAGQKDLFNG